MTKRIHVFAAKARLGLHRLTLLIILSGACGVLFSACSEDEEAYPNVTSELADMYTDEQGVATQLVLDDDRSFRISNPRSGLVKNAIYRVVAGFETVSDAVRIYQLGNVGILRDSTETPSRDPLKVISIWRTSRYVNLHVAPKTQGGSQYWGFITDSIVDGHPYLSLHHNQNGDPKSYTQDTYLSLPIDSIRDCDPSAPITMHIATPDGPRTYELK